MTAPKHKKTAGKGSKKDRKAGKLRPDPAAAPNDPIVVAEVAPARRTGRRFQVRRSGIHGKGVFAVQALAKGETLIEYVGEIIDWPEALSRHPHDPDDPNHTFYFTVDEEHVIDANVGGNASRWINHSCKPNCEADDQDGRIFIKTRRAIEPGEELFYDYGLVLDGKITKKLRKQYECRCGAKKCRGTMLALKKD